jgi:hypothetical protein
MTTQRLPLDNIHRCQGHAKKKVERLISPAQAAKTMREMKMKLCPRCATIARAYIEARKVKRTWQIRRRPLGADLVLRYDRWLKLSKSGIEIDEVLLALSKDANATRQVVSTVKGLADARRKEVANEPKTA